ncbi:MAG: transporter [Saprospiraceae bacterium]|nr:transporter [Saprospiraceae bacterium]MBK8635529.1 transporter [Saprospiraceae bacterium]
MVLLFFCFSLQTKAQTPNDAIMMDKRDACVLLAYTYGTFDQYWEGGNQRENQTIATVERQTILGMAAIGITKKLDFYVGLPYVKTKSYEPNGGYFAGANGLQDVLVGLKYQLINAQSSVGTFSILPSATFSTPVSKYLSDYQPYSLGLGTTEIASRLMANYKLDKGLYTTIGAAYLWRGYTEAERDYYYNNGSFYTNTMDVPSAWNFEALIGSWLFQNKLRLELNYSAIRSLSGDDIRAYNAPQPTNKVEMDRVGAFAQYYFNPQGGFGIVASYNTVFRGRNAPKMTSLNLGITYQFGY